MCIIVFIRLRDRRSAEQNRPRGIRSWLRQYFGNDETNYIDGQWEPPSYEKGNKNIEREAVDSKNKGYGIRRPGDHQVS